MTRFSAFSPKLVLGAAAALAAISLSPDSAQALVVTVGGLQYDVTTFTGTYDANTSKFAPPAAGGVMPWVNNLTLADQFASAVQGMLGFPNDCSSSPWSVICNREPGLMPPSRKDGPLFFKLFYPDNTQIWHVQWKSNANSRDEVGIVLRTDTVTWAQATPYTPPVPGPLPLFGAAAAFGFSRKLRKRIKLAPGAFSSALPRA